MNGSKTAYTDTTVSFTYAIIIFNVDTSSLVNKGPHFVNIAILNSRVKRSSLMERKKQILKFTITNLHYFSLRALGT